MTKLTKEQRQFDERVTVKKSEIKFTKRGNGPLVKNANGGKSRKPNGVIPDV